MFTPRSIEQIQKSYYEAVLQSGSGLVVDFSEGSLAYTLSRASAVLGAQMEQLLLSSQMSAGISTATGNRLDALGRGFLERYPARKATGYVLAQPSDFTTTLPFGTRLINLTTGQSYEVKSQPSTTLVPFVESRVPIEAVVAAEQGNVRAGTLLFSPDFPSVTFVVGAQKIGGSYTGDLIGGTDREPDEEYRSRLVARLAMGPTQTADYIRTKLLDYPLISRAYVSTTAPGVVEIWVDADTALTENQIKEIKDYIMTELPIGVVPIIFQANRRTVDFTLEVTPFSTSLVNLNQLSQQIKSALYFFLFRLGVGQSLNLLDLEKSMTPLVRAVTVLAPIQDIEVLPAEILYPGSIRVSYPITSI